MTQIQSVSAQQCQRKNWEAMGQCGSSRTPGPGHKWAAGDGETGPVGGPPKRRGQVCTGKTGAAGRTDEPLQVSSLVTSRRQLLGISELSVGELSWADNYYRPVLPFGRLPAKSTQASSPNILVTDLELQSTLFK